MFERDTTSHRFAVIGLGRFGLEVVQVLTAHGHEVLGVDCEEGPVQRAKDIATHAIQAEIADSEMVRELGIDEVDVAVVAIGDDIEASIFVTALLVEEGIKEIAVRASSRLHGLILAKIGATRVLYPEQESAHALAQQLRSPGITNYFVLAGNVGIARLVAPKVWCGRTVGELRTAPIYPGVVLAIQRGAETAIVPGADEQIQAGDILAVLSSDSQLDDLPNDSAPARGK